MKYVAGKPTGARRTDGTKEIGNICGHSHRTWEAAECCAIKQGDGWEPLPESAIAQMGQ